MSKEKLLSQEESDQLLSSLKQRFKKHPERHQEIQWGDVERKLNAHPEKTAVLYRMEETGGEPDVVLYDEEKDELVFFDCVKESPKGRRSVCYDREALDARKKYKPETSAVELAGDIGIEMLSEQEYRFLQETGEYDTKTSSWVKTPDDIRSKGGAIFCDLRYGRVFTYHNGAESYYAARGFRGSLRL
ncbi:DUF4256 domain-containing protein [Halobacillus kuroshimensis]|uniref:DUF4256 domain-containing protein n=1 Tax=Halobacillus kuroshimensis TaxID=302481 RepID=A0ABS3DRT3_9BACI|nr:DUF4256 domain-containing protein [Halobacillus kuroshimensis]MBN8234044.1 DUF4256 domain-containing protein [Halobacillus kuroshimensis]